MTFPEGFINGTLATAFTVFMPDLVKPIRNPGLFKVINNNAGFRYRHFKLSNKAEYAARNNRDSYANCG